MAEQFRLKDNSGLVESKSFLKAKVEFDDKHKVTEFLKRSLVPVNGKMIEL